MATNPAEIITRAIVEGASPAEVKRLAKKHAMAIEGMPRSEAEEFSEFLTDLSPEHFKAFNEGYISGVTEGGGLTTGLGPFGGGKATITKVTGAGAAAEGIRTGVVKGLHGAGSNLAQNQLLQKALRIFVGKPGKRGRGAALRIGGTAGLFGIIPGLYEDEFGQIGEEPGPGEPPGRGIGEAAFAAGSAAFAGMEGHPSADMGASEGAIAPSPEMPSEVADPGFNIMVIDHDGSLTGTPGAVAVVSSRDMGLAPSADAQAFIDSAPPILGTGQDTISMMSEFLMSVNQQGMVGDRREVRQVMFPETLPGHRVGIDVPFQQRPSVPEADRARSRRIGVPEAVGPEQPGAKPIGVTGTVDLPGGPTRVQPDPVNIPAGARISPRIFETFRDRTLMEWAQLSAQRHGVPLNVLYGLIDHESGWLRTAVGDNGTSFGLGQIHLPAWPNITRGQALNPVFNLEWTAQKLRERFNQYGRWDVAVAAHNSPVAAQHLARTGSFMDQKSARYVSSIMQRANQSGLANVLLDEGEHTPVARTGAGAAGPRLPAFQSPDPAQSREYIRQTYEQLLGRPPTEDELKTGVERINRLARQAFQANIRQIQGGESQEVDVGAQFEEGIKETGEFAFHTEVGQQRDFTDFAAGIARLLQQGI